MTPISSYVGPAEKPTALLRCPTSPLVKEVRDLAAANALVLRFPSPPR